MAKKTSPPAFDAELLDRLLVGRDPKTVLASYGLVGELKKALAERMLNAEIDVHLESEAERVAGNHRNGTSAKTVLTEDGELTLSIPRDRHGRFEPALIEKYRRRFPGFDDKIIALYARGMSTRDIQAHVGELYGISISPDLVSAVTDAVISEVTAWQNRPLESGYAIVFFDALRVKIRDEGLVRNKAVYPCGLDPIGWRPNALTARCSNCPRNKSSMRRSFGARWSSCTVPAAASTSWPRSSASRPGRSGNGSSRPTARLARGTVG